VAFGFLYLKNTLNVYSASWLGNSKGFQLLAQVQSVSSGPTRRENRTQVYRLWGKHTNHYQNALVKLDRFLQ